MSYITRHENRITKAEYGVEAGISGLNPIGKIAAWSAAHRWWVVVAFVMLFVSTMFVLSTVETKILEDNGVGESGVGAKLVEDGFDLLSAPTEQLVFSNPSLDAQSPVFRSTVQALVDQLADLSEVESVVSYYDTDSEAMVSALGCPAGTSSHSARVVASRATTSSSEEAPSPPKPWLAVTASVSRS